MKSRTQGEHSDQILSRLTKKLNNETFSSAECLFGTSDSWRVVDTSIKGATISESTPESQITCHVQQLLDDDGHLTFSEITDEIGISYGSTFSVIADEVGLRKVCTSWVPRLLIPEQKLNGLHVCERLVAKFLKEGNCF